MLSKLIFPYGWVARLLGDACKNWYFCLRVAHPHAKLNFLRPVSNATHPKKKNHKKNKNPQNQNLVVMAAVSSLQQSTPLPEQGATDLPLYTRVGDGGNPSSPRERYHHSCHRHCRSSHARSAIAEVIHAARSILSLWSQRRIHCRRGSPCRIRHSAKLFAWRRGGRTKETKRQRRGGRRRRSSARGDDEEVEERRPAVQTQARGDNEEAEERRCQIQLSRGCPSWSRSSHVHRREEGGQGKPFRRTLPYGGWSSLLATIYDLPTTRSDFPVTRFSLPTAWSCGFPTAGSSLPTSPCCSPHTGSPCTTLGGAAPLGGLGAGTWLERYGGGGAPLPRTQLWAMRRWRERERWGLLVGEKRKWCGVSEESIRMGGALG